MLIILIVCVILFLVFIWVGLALDVLVLLIIYFSCLSFKVIAIPFLCFIKYSDDDTMSYDDAAWATVIPGLLCAVPIFRALVHHNV